VDPTVLAAILTGLIASVPSTWVVLRSTKHAREIAKEATDQAREQAAEEARLTRSASLALELGRIREDLRGTDRSIAWDALDDLRTLMMRVASPIYTDDDRATVWRLMQSRTAAKAAQIERYPEQELPQVQVRPELEEGL
jgi:hypothetical protein